ncbi:putative monooxygenase (luciferase-like) [Rhodococcoides trifolii]|uniref:Monooxygenase (Luciferase-like) n=1 Tax=Rhodococcoides trifolii TaxID=908250 RepID=A0A917CPQ1_9NOCA|nr:LLM class flavin-dependent oxidoreductase [Rhodococcus trifolii]GGF94266.1 putative monooxygenase (luciferase-like) [Rhodococcus trifolii]
MTIPLSVLDLSPIPEGSTPAQALRNTLDLARNAEEWGYARYWVAEHHFAAVASSSPATLIGLIAAATNRIRVGSAAVQLGHHTPISVVESFGTVDALYPGRVDLGIGRSGQKRAEALAAGPAPIREARVVDGLLVPAPVSLAAALRATRLAATVSAVQFPGSKPPAFAGALDDVLALLSGTFSYKDIPLEATPGTGADLQVWLFGSSGGESAQLAGKLGLPFAANYHVSPATTLDAVDAYRNAFVPSQRLAEPYIVVSADAVVADDDETARELASTFSTWVHSIRSGHGAIEYPKSAPALTDDEAVLVADRVETQFVGSAATVVAQLETLARVTGANELVVTGMTHDHEDRKRSFQLLAKEWGLPALRVN